MRTGKDLEESGGGVIIELLSQKLPAGTKENRETPEVYTRFQQITSKIRV
jgi:hypothetical protein